VRVQWRPADGGAPAVADVRAPVPLVISAGEPAVVPLPLRIPAGPGIYALTVAIPALGVSAPAATVEVRRARLATSADEPAPVAARYALTSAVPPARVAARQRVDLEVAVANTGDALWLARARKDRGTVKLGWRWRAGGVDVEQGRAPLAHDVFPGQSYRFRAEVVAPGRPGAYTLEVGLLGEYIAWFSDRGTEPLRFDVEVR
jgi:hypothetical protein